ncbi:unnamed protein product [Diamesa hyperborea]
MQEGYVSLNSVPTHIMTWGNWIEDKFDEKTKEIVVVMTGNPGLPGFYTTFCSTLYNELDKEVPIWVIGHAGHDDPGNKSSLIIPAIKGNEDLYNLKGQTDHKVDFIKTYIPKDVKIHLIAHSIGSYISLDLLKIPEIDERIQQCYFLFPTIENMVETKNGYILSKVLDPIFFIMRYFYRFINFLPLTLRTLMVYVYCLCTGTPKYFMGTVLKYLEPAVIDKIWFMALDEMELVREIDTVHIQQNMHRLKFYYGLTDGWVPEDSYKRLIEKFPGIDAELCSQKLEHAFVIKSGPLVGRMVSDWIKKKRVH